MKNWKLQHFFIIAIGVIVFDQIVKMVIYNTMLEGETIPVFGDWFKIHYITNPGMAFGLQLKNDYGKLLLSLFRVAALGAIIWYMRALYQTGKSRGLLMCMGFILGGAAGNLFDSTFYGIMDANLKVDPESMALFHGKVIDMFYLDIASGYYPEGWPIVGGDWYSFWPVFNIADAAIFCAVIVILFKQRSYFKKEEEVSSPSDVSVSESEITNS